MKPKFAMALIAGMCLLLAAACKPSTKDLEKKVRTNIEETLNKKAEEKGIELKVVDFTMTPTQDDQYNGVLKTTENGRDFTYDVDVRVEGEDVKWQIRN